MFSCSLPPSTDIRLNGAININERMGHTPVSGPDGSYRGYFLKFKQDSLPQSLEQGDPDPNNIAGLGGTWFGMVCGNSPSGGATCEATNTNDNASCAMLDLSISGGTPGTVGTVISHDISNLSNLLTLCRSPSDVCHSLACNCVVGAELESECTGF